MLGRRHSHNDQCKDSSEPECHSSLFQVTLHLSGSLPCLLSFTFILPEIFPWPYSNE